MTILYIDLIAVILLLLIKYQTTVLPEITKSIIDCYIILSLSFKYLQTSKMNT